MLSEEEKRRTAYHESGHAIVGMLTPGADPVRKVSIIPRTMSLGVTISSPDSERTNYDVEYLTGRIKVALGGRIAEEIVYGSISAGAESDIQQLTGIARQMVGRWGMSEAVGPIAVIPSEAPGPAAAGRVRGLGGHAGARSTARSSGSSTSSTRPSCTLLTENRDKLDSLTERLLEEETLDMDDAYAAAGLVAPRAPAVEEPLTA